MQTHTHIFIRGDEEGDPLIGCWPVPFTRKWCFPFSGQEVAGRPSTPITSTVLLLQLQSLRRHPVAEKYEYLKCLSPSYSKNIQKGKGKEKTLELLFNRKQNIFGKYYKGQKCTEFSFLTEN